MYRKTSLFALVIILANIMVMSTKHLTGEHLHRACSLSAELRSRGYPCHRVRQNLYLLLGKMLLGDLLTPSIHKSGLFKQELSRLREIVKMVDLMSAPAYVCPQESSKPPPSSTPNTPSSSTPPTLTGLDGLILVWPKLKVEGSIEFQVPVVTMVDPKCKPGKSLRALSVTRGMDTALENLNQYLAEDMCDLIPKSFVLDTQKPQNWKTFIRDYQNNSTMIISKKLEKLRGDESLNDCYMHAAQAVVEDQEENKNEKDKGEDTDKTDKKKNVANDIKESLLESILST